MTDRASNSPMCDEQEEPRKFPSLTVSKDDILTALSSSKRLTFCGLQQISPWHLKKAMTAPSNGDCATTAALLATRWARGDFLAILGELAAKSKLIALCRYEQNEDVRPIGLG